MFTSPAKPTRWGRPLWCAFLLLACMGLFACAAPNYLLDAAPVNRDLTIHVVIENPAGSGEKWEVRARGELIREGEDGHPIRILHLPWPVNGGMVPRTLYSEALGGDREPVDALVLGPAIARGELVRAVPIGLLRVIDHLERDDKVIAVVPDTVFDDVRDVAELETRFPGIQEILSLWFAWSRPGGGIEVQGFGSRAEAGLLISEGAAAFDDALRRGDLPEWGQ